MGLSTVKFIRALICLDHGPRLPCAHVQEACRTCLSQHPIERGLRHTETRSQLPLRAGEASAVRVDQAQDTPRSRPYSTSAPVAIRAFVGAVIRGLIHGVIHLRLHGFWGGLYGLIQRLLNPYRGLNRGPSRPCDQGGAEHVAAERQRRAADSRSSVAGDKPS